MKYHVTIEGKTHEVDVHLEPDGRVSVSLDGKPYDADPVLVPGGVSLRIDGRVFDVAVGGTPESNTLAAGLRRTVAEVESQRARSGGRRKKKGGGGGGKEVRAPMPGRIVKILVGVGDDVAANQAVIVIEAMKMENELRAAGAGKVRSLEVSEGQNVEGNVLLLTFE